MSGGIVVLGEVLLRLDPGEGRIRSAASFDVRVGGGEFNAARAARAVFGVPARIVTALTDDPVGRLIESHILSSGVDVRHLLWREPRPGVRNGLNFTERGFGVRASTTVYDRENSAAAQLAPADVDWSQVLQSGDRWFHTGGIFAALAPGTRALALEGLDAARAAGIRTSVDLNHRPSLFPGDDEGADAGRLFGLLADRADVLFAGLADLARLGADGGRGTYRERFAAAGAEVLAARPTIGLVVTTERLVHSATRNAWTVLARSRDDGLIASRTHELEILDRVGGGDAMAAGMITGTLEGLSLPAAIERAAAAGALAMSTAGDHLDATRAEVDAVAAGTPPAAVR